MKPSSDIEISDVSLPIAAFLIVSAFEDLDRFRIKNSSSAAGVVQQPVRDECLNINMFSSLGSGAGGDQRLEGGTTTTAGDAPRSATRRQLSTLQSASHP